MSRPECSDSFQPHPTASDNQAKKAFGAVLAFQSHIGLPAIRRQP